MIFKKDSVREEGSWDAFTGFSDSIPETPKGGVLKNYTKFSLSGEHKIFSTGEYLSLIALREKGLLFKNQLKSNSPG